MSNRKHMPVSLRLYYGDPFDDVIIENINKLDRKNGTITKFLRRHLYDSIRGVMNAPPPIPVKYRDEDKTVDKEINEILEGI